MPTCLGEVSRTGGVLGNATVGFTGCTVPTTGANNGASAEGRVAPNLLLNGDFSIGQGNGYGAPTAASE